MPLSHWSWDSPSHNYCHPLCHSTHFQPYPCSHLPCHWLLQYHLALLHSQNFSPSMVRYYIPSKLATILKHIALQIDRWCMLSYVHRKWSHAGYPNLHYSLTKHDLPTNLPSTQTTPTPVESLPAKSWIPLATSSHMLSALPTQCTYSRWTHVLLG